MPIKFKILFLTGSMNQTLQMESIASFLPDFECYFSQLFSDNFFIAKAIKLGVLDTTILGNPLRDKSEKYLIEKGLSQDYQAIQNDYDLVVYCSDMIIPKKLRGIKSLWVQEGMIDPYTTLSKIIQQLKLPRYWSMGTSLNGTSNECDIYCTASTAYSEYIVKYGTNRKKTITTGIPNYDDLNKHLINDFPHHNYVMVATTDMRETFRYENRLNFLRKCLAIADGRKLLFKLHPNEKSERAIQEIKQVCPENTLIFTAGNTNEMIANSCELITQYSTVVYTGIALGKKVHSYFNLDDLYAQMPVQNGGKSAENIAQICREYCLYEGSLDSFLSKLNAFNPLDHAEVF